MTVDEDDYHQLLRSRFEAQQCAFRQNGKLDYAARLAAVDALLQGILACKEELARALDEDFGGRAHEETYLLDMFSLVEEIRFVKRHLKEWMRPQRVAVGWQFLPSTARVLHQPLGVVGIIGPWNYPLLLNLSPLVAALAAGNHAMVKPSELAPRSAERIRQLIADLYPPEYVTVITGGPEISAAFSALPFDHLLFTGSTRVGRLVMRAASENLTPVTLELGGKSPTIVHPQYPLRRAAERILTGKLFNAGQTCIAPDYLLLHDSQREAFLRLAWAIVRERYPRLVANRDYTRIIN